ncbi:hypothetical protein F5887DRAFT_1059883 [Amanita rubescens]|nr:hypothetical protein F5887DRAFT_1059883 [Amanita rubescens]
MSDLPTDVSRPSALPTANLFRSQKKNWNKKVDTEVDSLVDGMLDLVALASACLIADKDKFRIAQEAFQAQSRAESMVRAANSLLSITHSMKLLLLLSDEAQIAHRRDAELKVVQTERDDARKKVAVLLDELFLS